MTPADGRCGDLEKLSNVTPSHEGENLNEEENKLSLVRRELQFGIAQRVVVDKKNRKKQGVC